MSARAYADTSAFIALMDESDSFHSLFRRLFSDPPSLYTTTFVIAEAHGWFLKRFDIYRGLEFLSAIETMNFLEIYVVDNKLRNKTVQMIKRFNDQTLTMADAGLSLMRQKRIKRCWSTDYHLGLTGVPLVIHKSS